MQLQKTEDARDGPSLLGFVPNPTDYLCHYSLLLVTRQISDSRFTPRADPVGDGADHGS